jgi:hypothetical protein
VYLVSKLQPTSPHGGQRMHIRPIVARVLAGAALTTTLAAAGLVIAMPAPAAAGPSQVYVVHAIPATPVDVWFNGELKIPNFQPKAVAGPLS